VEKGWLPADLFVGLEATGERARGKPQFRINEARAFIETALADTYWSRSGLPAAMALLMGLRASEVTNRECRDGDDDGRVCGSIARRLARAIARASPKIKQPTFRSVESCAKGDSNPHTVKY
jgi:hypothetical protein